MCAFFSASCVFQSSLCPVPSPPRRAPRPPGRPVPVALAAPMLADGALTPAAPARTKTKQHDGLSHSAASTSTRCATPPRAHQPRGEWACALSKAILWTGRLTVTDAHVLFAASLFGVDKRKAVPWRRVECVRPVARLGLPNAIELVWRTPGGALKPELFVSFFARDAALRAMLAAWRDAGGGPGRTPAGLGRQGGWAGVARGWRTPKVLSRACAQS